MQRTLVDYVRQKPHEPRAFDGSPELALVERRETRLLARKDTTMRIEELFEQFHVFVVEIFDVVYVEFYFHGSLERNVFRINVLFGILDLFVI